jgi:hypothetical protein
MMPTQRHRPGVGVIVWGIRPTLEDGDAVIRVKNGRGSAREEAVAQSSRCQPHGGIMRTIEDVLNHVRAEYLEMPGLRLKPEEVQRLCNIERTMCQLVLDSLVESTFLCLWPDGAYARATDSAAHPHRAKADSGHVPRPVHRDFSAPGREGTG